MKKSFGKKLDSFRLKRNLDKSKSVENARVASLGILPGSTIPSCPVCSESKRNFLQTIYNFDYQECTECGCAYVSNPPPQKDLEGFYRSDYYSNSNKLLYANDEVIDYRVEQVFQPKVEWINGFLTTPKKTWLDIGCGVGEALYLAKEKGFEVLGLETNPMEREYGMRRFGIRIENEYINEETLPKYLNNWGVISLFSILEHLLEPVAMIKLISSAQDRNDNLVIEVPNFPSISSTCQMLFPDLVNRMMHPPAHLFLFTLKSITLLLGRFSYKICGVWYFGQDFYEFFSTIGLLRPELNQSALHERFSGLINDFQLSIDKAELSDEMLLIAKKV